jgi:hypothetical protein
MRVACQVIARVSPHGSSGISPTRGQITKSQGWLRGRSRYDAQAGTSFGWNEGPAIGQRWLTTQVQVACKSVQSALENCWGSRYSARHSASMSASPLAYERRGSMCPRCPDRRATRTAYFIAHSLVTESYYCANCGYVWDIFRTTSGMRIAEPGASAETTAPPARDAV